MNERLYRFLRPIITFLFKLIMHPKIIGKENIPKNGRIILAGTHTSIMDPPFLVSLTKRTIHFLAKEELTHGILGNAFKSMGIIPVIRHQKDPNAYKHAIKVLNKNEIIGIFPEGTINKTDKPTIPFHTGCVRMAYQTNSKIIPFVIIGKYRPFKIKIILDKPYTVLTDDYQEETKKLQDHIDKMILEERKWN